MKRKKFGFEKELDELFNNIEIVFDKPRKNSFKKNQQTIMGKKHYNTNPRTNLEKSNSSNKFPKAKY